MRLIDGDALQLRVNLKGTNKFGMLDENIRDFIDAAPTVDAEVVTRCKDCKHKGWVQEPCHGKSIDYCRVWDCTLRNLESTFCNYGEPKRGTP